MSAAPTPRTRKPPASYQPGRLLARLARDLPDHRMRRTAAGVARFAPEGAGPVIEAAERVERHAMMAVTKIEFACDLGGGPGRERLRLRHTGAVRRRGLAATPESAAAELLLADQAVRHAMMPLDFRWFEIRCDDCGWHAATELVGASEVVLRLPPTRAYVPLSADQRDALVATFDALAGILGRC